MTNQNWNTNAPQDPPNYGQVPTGDGATPSYEPPATGAPGGYTLRLTPESGQVVVCSGGLEGRLVGLSGQLCFVL